MTLLGKLQQDVKQAMLARDDVTRDTLRMVIAAVKKWEVDNNRDAADPDVLGLLQNAQKTRLESVEQFTKGGREDLVQKERAEIEVVRRYLPRQLGEAETRALVQGLAGELGVTAKKDSGRLMKELMSRHKGAIDGKLAQRIALELLTD